MSSPDLINDLCRLLSVVVSKNQYKNQSTYGKTDLSESEELTDEERLISGLMTGAG